MLAPVEKKLGDLSHVFPRKLPRFPRRYRDHLGRSERIALYFLGAAALAFASFAVTLYHIESAQATPFVERFAPVYHMDRPDASSMDQYIRKLRDPHQEWDSRTWGRKIA